MKGVESRSVLLRDLLIFQTKLALDAIKDVALLKASLVAVVIDLLFMRVTRGRCFYGVLRLSERIDLWLNLNGAARTAQQDPDGLFGVSRAGSASYLGKLEELVRRATDAPEYPHKPAAQAP